MILSHIVDDFTRSTWVCLMHSKLDVFPMVKQFMSFIQTQFSAVVKIIRTDNVMEFFNMNLVFISSPWAFYIKFLVPIPHRKMDFLNVSIGISLMSLVLSSCKPLFLTNTGVIVYTLLFISLNVFLLHSFLTKLLMKPYLDTHLLIHISGF